MLSRRLSCRLAVTAACHFCCRAKGCQRNYDTGGVPVNDVVLHPNQAELISGDQNGGIRTWDLRYDGAVPWGSSTAACQRKVRLN
jgi:hypothetical protein